MKRTNQKGQALIMVVVVMGVFLIGALGLAIDTSQLFTYQQMAQIAADASAQAAMLSVFQGVNTSGAAAFPTNASFTCTQYPRSTPCQYARMNGFGGASDTVAVFPETCSLPSGCGTAPPTPAQPSPPNQITVRVTRRVSNTLIRMVGAGAFSSISAVGTAAVVGELAPIPILIIHPNLAGALSGDSNTTIKIKGGPSRSIQVNSTAETPDALGGGIPFVDLSEGYRGTGSDFGVFGGPTSEPSRWVSSNSLGSGHYLQPASPVPDPLCVSGVPETCNVAPPDKNALAPAPSPITISPGTSVDPLYGCPTKATLGSQMKHCIVYGPGIYTSIINPSQDMAIFQPGVYWMDNGVGFGTSSHGGMMMCSGSSCSNDAVTQDGMLVYNSGGGYFSITGNSTVKLKGTPVSGRYKGVLFFQDRNSPATGTGASSQHQIGGGGDLQLSGTIYITNTVDTILRSSGYLHYQQVNYHGGPCSSTFVSGLIIVDVLSLSGGGCINMFLSPTADTDLQQVALIGGGAHP